MRYIELNGKKRRVKGTFGAFQKLMKKYKDDQDIKNWEPIKTIQFSYDLVWNFLDYAIKPFLFKSRFYKKADTDDIQKAQDVVLSIFYGVDMSTEDKEQKNETMKKERESPSRNG